MFCVLLVIASSEYVYVSIFCEVLSIAILLHLIYHDGNPNHRIPWIVVLLILPPAGLLIYLIFGRRYISKKHSRKYQSVKDKQSEFNRQDEEVINKLPDKYQTQSKYIYNTSDSPIYENTKVEYLNDGKIYFEKLLHSRKTSDRIILFSVSLRIIKGGADRWQNAISAVRA